MTSMQTVIVTALVAGLAVALFMTVRGVRDARRPDRPLAAVRLVVREQPGEPSLFASITVVNSSARPAVITVASRRVSLLRRLLTPPRSRRRVLARHKRFTGFELLGAIDGWQTRTWVTPIPKPSRRVRVDVLIYEAGRLPSLVSSTHVTPRESVRVAGRRVRVVR